MKKPTTTKSEMEVRTEHSKKVHGLANGDSCVYHDTKHGNDFLKDQRMRHIEVMIESALERYRTRHEDHIGYLRAKNHPQIP